MAMRGCPNLDAKIEGKGIISSGHWVTRCRAQGNREIAPDTVIRVCVHNPRDQDYVQCCMYRNKSVDYGQTPVWQQCRHCKNIYG